MNSHLIVKYNGMLVKNIQRKCHWMLQNNHWSSVKMVYWWYDQAIILIRISCKTSKYFISEESHRHYKCHTPSTKMKICSKSEIFFLWRNEGTWLCWCCVMYSRIKSKSYPVTVFIPLVTAEWRAVAIAIVWGPVEQKNVESEHVNCLYSFFFL